jgi:hypothetical protein
MPISNVFSSSYVQEGRFTEFPHSTEFGHPSENSRITGFSLQVFFNLGYNRAEQKEPKTVDHETEQ